MVVVSFLEIQKLRSKLSLNSRKSTITNQVADCRGVIAASLPHWQPMSMQLLCFVPNESAAYARLTTGPSSTGKVLDPDFSFSLSR
jgi:hypothetical protein